MPNRYVRDELISIALQMAQLPNLEVHDMPNGVVQQNAFSIQWLQDILDFWYHMVPFSATVRKISLTCTANSDNILLPTDFILDVRNGLLVRKVPDNANSYERRLRTPLQKFINRQMMYQGAVNVNFPLYYCVAGDDGNVLTQRQTMLITPTPTINTQCQLWYYQLPAKLEANQKPKFPNDYCCIEYLRIRAHEWQGLYEPGTAQKFCDKIVASMKSAGLMNEPEDDEIPMDEQVYIRRNQDSTNTYAWLGPV
jgi:hypothetical protein